MNEANLAAREADLDETDLIRLLRDELGLRTGATSDLAALTENELDVVDLGTGGDALEWQAVALGDGGVAATGQLIADLHAGAGDDVGLAATVDGHEGDVRRTVRIVLDRRNDRRLDLLKVKVDQAVEALYVTTTVANGDLALVVTPRTGLLGDQ